MRNEIRLEPQLIQSVHSMTKWHESLMKYHFLRPLISYQPPAFSSCLKLVFPAGEENLPNSCIRNYVSPSIEIPQNERKLAEEKREYWKTALM